MNGGEQYLAYCLDLARGQNKLSNKDISILKKFYMAQQALSQELLEAKPLGICKITTSPGGATEVDTLGQKDCISGRENSKETLS